MTETHPLAASFRSLAVRGLRRFGYDIRRLQAGVMNDPRANVFVDPGHVEVLADPAFRASLEEVAGLTVLDLPRLANLWTLCQMTNPAGGILEVGAYRGGSALHLSNSAPHRRLFVCDSFSGFRSLDPSLDQLFTADMFLDTSSEAVEALFRSRNRPAAVITGYFPESCAEVGLAPLSFVHLDVDTYEATSAALEFLPSKMTEQSLIVSDDYNRKAEGVNRAVTEFVRRNHDWIVLPVFPSQAVLLHDSWFNQSSEL
jgi:hypothetical protein